MANSCFAKYPDFLTESWRPVCGLSKEDFKVFRVLLDVKPFNPEDISIKTVGRNLIIKGKHENHFDKHGFVSREFKREYVLDEEYDPKSVSSVFGLDGYLKVVAYTKVLWEEFMKGECETEKFTGYIDLQPYRVKALNFEIEDGIMNLHVKVVHPEFLKWTNHVIKHRYVLPLNVLRETVYAHLNKGMIEIIGYYPLQEKLPPSEQTDGMNLTDAEADRNTLKRGKVGPSIPPFTTPSAEQIKEFVSKFHAKLDEMGYLD